MASYSKAFCVEGGQKVFHGTYRVCWRFQGQPFQRTVETEKQAKKAAEWITDRVTLIKQGRADGPPTGADIGVWFMSAGKQGLAVDKQAENGRQTLSAIVGAYLDARIREKDAGNLSGASYASDVYRLERFKQHCEREHKSKLADIVTAEFLGEYRGKLLGQLAKGKASAVSVKHILRTVKACFKWAYKHEKLDQLPRVLDDYAKVALPQPTPTFYTVEEVKALFNAASPRTQVYILLGLNLGYTQADIASMEHDTIDWATGIVTRPRHKTGQPQQGKLWPITVKLLKQEMTDPRKSKLVLLGENGNPLIVDTVNEKGNPIRVDAIRLAFNRVKVKLEIKNDSRGFAIFRKTSANNIAQANQNAPHLVDLFLGHTQKTMAKHYANQHFDLLFTETDKLASLYGFQAN